MKQAAFFAKALGVAIALPVSGIIALSGAGVVNAATCPPGTVPVMQNGVAGCTASGSSTTPSGGSDSSTGSPQPVTPIRTADPENPSPTQPLTPMTPSPNSSVPAPAPVATRGNPTPPPPLPEPAPSPTNIGSDPGSSASQIATATPTEAAAPSNNAVGTSTMPPREPAVGSTGGFKEFTQGSYPPELNEIKVEEVAPGSASEAKPFNPAGIFVAGLTGLLAVLVGLLFWVNKKHAAKKLPAK